MQLINAQMVDYVSTQQYSMTLSVGYLHKVVLYCSIYMFEKYFFWRAGFFQPIRAFLITFDWLKKKQLSKKDSSDK